MAIRPTPPALPASVPQGNSLAPSECQWPYIVKCIAVNIQGETVKGTCKETWVHYRSTVLADFCLSLERWIPPLRRKTCPVLWALPYSFQIPEMGVGWRYLYLVSFLGLP